MTTKQEWALVGNMMQDVLDKLKLEAPNTGNVLEFDIDGYWTISNYDRKVLKRYKVFESALDYLMLND